MSTDLQTPTQEVNIIENSLQEFTNAGVILKNNQTRAAKAVAVGKKILADLEANGGEMTPELDTRMQAYLANCAAAAKDMNESRKAITQTLTLIQKAFTGEENKLDKDNAATVAYQIQQIRNAYAKQIFEAEQARQREIKAKAERDQEVINIKAECKKRLITFVGGMITTGKNNMQSSFNSLSLADIDERGEKLRNAEPALSYEKYMGFTHNISSRLLSSEEVDRILKPEIISDFSAHAIEYKTQLTELKGHLVERLPSKKKELQSIREMELEEQRLKEEQERLKEQKAKAGAEEQKRIEAEQQANAEKQRKADAERQQALKEQQEREEAERKQQAIEEQQRQEAAAQQVEMDKNVNETMTLFEAEKEAAEGEGMPEARTGYEIEVLVPAAYLQMVQLWFTLEGQTLTLAQLEKKLGFAKKFCEDIAHKDETKKIAGSMLRYTHKVTAVNRSKKK